MIPQMLGSILTSVMCKNLRSSELGQRQVKLMGRGLDTLACWDFLVA